jgi:acyl-CoA thioesterase
MDEAVKKAIFNAVRNEPFAGTLNLELVELDVGRSVVEMTYDPATMSNMFGRAHGGAIFTLIDEAFETVCQSDGIVTVALNVSITYLSSPEGKTRLRAEAVEINRTKRTANYDIKVRDQNHRLIATCQALGYRTGKPLPFL